MEELKSVIGLGIAGNFANHLEQAGEAGDFIDVKVDDEKAPKGIFPFYLPGDFGHFLNTFPLSSQQIAAPQEGGNLQIEPEIAILFEIEYNASEVANLKPLRFYAYNDCSIRKPGAKKISEKKNWGEATKGVSAASIQIDSFTPQGAINNYRIASFLLRDAKLHEYGVDSPVAGYSYFYNPLLSWIIEKMNRQKDEGPLEEIAAYLKKCGYPKKALISIGATTYTETGKSAFLKPGDRSIVVVYDGRQHTPQQVQSALEAGRRPQEALILEQDVTA